MDKIGLLVYSAGLTHKPTHN